MKCQPTTLMLHQPGSDDFEKLGTDFEKTIGYTPGKVGMAEAHLVSQRAAVGFGVEWLRKNRKAGLNHA
jgi:aminoglycoside N3'-acetyltransferase